MKNQTNFLLQSNIFQQLDKNWAVIFSVSIKWATTQAYPQTQVDRLVACKRYVTPKEVSKVVVQRFSVKKVFLEILQNSQENNCVRVSLPEACTFIKKQTLVQVFSCEFCEISNIFFIEHLWTTASEVSVSNLFHFQVSVSASSFRLTGET